MSSHFDDLDKLFVECEEYLEQHPQVELVADEEQDVVADVAKPWIVWLIRPGENGAEDLFFIASSWTYEEAARHARGLAIAAAQYSRVTNIEAGEAVGA